MTVENLEEWGKYGFVGCCPSNLDITGFSIMQPNFSALRLYLRHDKILNYFLGCADPGFWWPVLFLFGSKQESVCTKKKKEPCCWIVWPQFPLPLFEAQSPMAQNTKVYSSFRQDRTRLQFSPRGDLKWQFSRHNSFVRFDSKFTIWLCWLLIKDELTRVLMGLISFLV